MSNAKVLLVEDDPAIARSIVFALERGGLTVMHSLLLSDARRQLAVRAFELLILDVGLPDGNGLDFCRELRASPVYAGLPVLMLSAHGEEIDRVLGLELGADDYVTKPFSPRELLARVRGMLRRAQRPAAAPVSGLVAGQVCAYGCFELDIAGQRVSLHGKALTLTRREYGLLADLLQHQGRIRSRDALLTAVWGNDSDSTDRTVDTHIKTLRAKLQELAAAQDCIVTHRGMGYSIDLAKV